MNKSRLLTLADFLENEVKDDWFSLGTWASPGFTEHQCGSTACAAGWATACFPDSGFTLVPIHPDKDMGSVPQYEEEEGSDAAAAFFEITDPECVALFYKDGDKRDVIERLRKFARSH